MKCPKCKCEQKVKNGIIKGKQRYKFKSCNYNYNVEYKTTAKYIDTRKFGLMMYLEDLDFHSIGRLLNVSRVSVIHWIRKYGEQLKEIKTEKPLRILELNEMHNYNGSKKNYKWIWTAVD